MHAEGVFTVAVLGGEPWFLIASSNGELTICRGSILNLNSFFTLLGSQETCVLVLPPSPIG